LKKEVAEKPDLSSCAPLANFLVKVENFMMASETDLLVETLTSADDSREKKTLISWLTRIS
jgi:hypothetical protein